MSSSKRVRISQLAQTPEAEDEVTNLPEGTLPEGTLVFSQTPDIAVRVYTLDGQPRLNLYNKQTGITELRGVPATAESTASGTTYRYAGELTVEIAIAQSGEQIITINGQPQQKGETVTGTVSYLPRIALPPDAVVEVSLVEIGQPNEPVSSLASTQILSGGRQVPFSFELPYDLEQIDPSLSYGLSAKITVDNTLQFATTSDLPVITNGNPTEVAVQVEQVDSTEVVSEEGTLIGTVWQLQQISYNNDELLETTSPSNYTLEFLEDGQVAIRADCNQVKGRFTTEGSSLSIELGASTLAICPPESIDQRYLQALQGGVIYFFQEGDLFIDIKYDTGTMRFSPAV
ncbi:YbaY family lipoprotein [Synechococcus sp. PCC 7335]|uniref:YbaY family lipoprotein n=1 Tax=Synechococcus sp. (strain ATCC 29403 / PCC 7335) TaxID=91464 RepID=UPI0018DCF6FE|nr:YbaY family lipoprotein [Synechococcus sp. PCC 7335]